LLRGAHISPLMYHQFAVTLSTAVRPCRQEDLPQVLRTIRDVLEPKGLFYLGLYGGKEHEGVWPEDTYEPKRFFCFHTDDQIRRVTSESFELLRFKRIALEGEEEGFHFQSLILRRGRVRAGSHT
jgi:hypothetical protein